MPSDDFLCAPNPTIGVTPGDYKIAYAGMIQCHPKLSTGTVEFEVREPAKPAQVFTAWGNKINGRQARVCFPAGQRRSYRHGETVQLVVRDRNVGKEGVSFRYVPQFFKEAPPTMTDRAGNQVPLRGADALSGGGMHPSADAALAPGKEVELYEWKAALRPAGDRDSEYPNFGIICGTGKFSIRYDRVLANSSASAIEIDPGLSKPCPAEPAVAGGY